ncbi:MAG TPA: phosphatidate cytidylyltransferase [Caulobacteraceae bacterium]|nr:phosphatidate cytidylyltransferase [Caulobacteraceae bacterium]
MTPSPPAKGFNWSNLGVRIMSAAILAPAMLYCAFVGGWLLMAVVAASVILVALEWARMSAPAAPRRVAAAVTTAVLAAALTDQVGHYRIAWLVLVLGSGVCALASRAAAARPADAAFGVLYIGAPSLALIWLRAWGGGGQMWTFLVLASAWSADIVAFLAGNVFKGPKLWPQFSPNKTWSGFFGGLIAATLAAAAVARVGAIWRPNELSVGEALLVGAFAGLATMAGDLWESMLKRRFGVKDSGGLIPGHGGLLDRIDGLMFALLAVAAARVLVNLGWAH